ncbi:MAG: helix-hairpin-helix domain-containing protein [Verrucomicrobiales bacterium]|nr:helix-hairpin-helix domain-containing protein [Verrucomicrobiales bacterium]
MKTQLLRFLFVASLLISSSFASELKEFPDCELVVTTWADGDSFLVRTADGEEHTVRIYGADCMEWHVSDDSDARRLREQRRYFGITYLGGDPAISIDRAKAFGEEAAVEVREILSKPFTIHTSMSDAAGDGRYKRIYGFVKTHDGKDLAEHLVARGLARAVGVSRGTYDQRSRDEYRAQLEDLELIAARKSIGIWAATEWESLAIERREQRIEDELLALATGKSKFEENEKIDPNTATKDDLVRLPGIGEVLANAIIEERDSTRFLSPEDLEKVSGVGKTKAEKMSPYLIFPEE